MNDQIQSDRMLIMRIVRVPEGATNADIILPLHTGETLVGTAFMPPDRLGILYVLGERAMRRHLQLDVKETENENGKEKL